MLGHLLQHGAGHALHTPRTTGDCTLRLHPGCSLDTRPRQHTVTHTHRQVAFSSRNGAGPEHLSAHDLQCLERAAVIADSSAGLTAPHPNAGCVLVSQDGRTISETFQRAQGTESAEAQAIGEARADASGATAYLNLESGDCHGDDSAVRSLLQSGVSRVVIGMRHPLSHLRGHAIGLLRGAGVRVDVLGEVECRTPVEDQLAAQQACFAVNEALLHRAALGKPFGILKYAMTLDGKIATSMGHAAWISSAVSRQHVFETRSRSDAVVVGGQTVRRDNPRLTTRREGGHMPCRIVMSRIMDLPEDANLWDVSSGGPTIVFTQSGARADFQARLRDRGVEVIEFPFLTPERVAEYCYDRGFLQVLWECGGTLAAPAITGATIHKAMAFIAPKLVGGVRAPTPVGELGNVEMTQAQQLVETAWHPIGPDMLLTGYLPAAGGLWGLHHRLSTQDEASSAVALLGTLQPPQPQPQHSELSADPRQRAAAQQDKLRRQQKLEQDAVKFYKSWDRHGALSNFSPHPIDVAGPDGGAPQRWASVEHFYQAHKFVGSPHPEAAALVQEIQRAASPEEAARLGRGAQRQRPQLVRPDWEAAKLGVMRAALAAKFRQHAAPRAMLLATAAGKHGPQQLMENSPHDFFWGGGWDASGHNHLGRLLMELRQQLLQEHGQPAAAQAAPNVGPASAHQPVSV